MKNVEDFYQEVAVSMLANESAFELLTIACELRGQLDLPSWIPDWTAGNATTSWPWWSSTSSEDSQVCYQIHNDGRTLYLRDKSIGSILQRATRGMPVLDRGVDWFSRWYDLCQEAWSIMREWAEIARNVSLYSTGERPAQVFLELFNRSTKDNKTGFREWCNMLLDRSGDSAEKVRQFTDHR